MRENGNRKTFCLKIVSEFAMYCCCLLTRDLPLEGHLLRFEVFFSLFLFWFFQAPDFPDLVKRMYFCFLYCFMKFTPQLVTH